jgi:basic membrane protein A and related proteins
MKYIDVAAYDMIKAELEGKFPGGEMLMFDATNNGIGIPRENPNLDPDVVEKVTEAFEAMQAGTLVVSDVQGNLFR